MTLNIFYQCDLHHLSIVIILDDDGNLCQTCQHCRTQTALAGDQFKVLTLLSHYQWLHYTKFLDGRSKCLQLFFIKVATRLIGVGANAFDCHLLCIFGSFLLLGSNRAGVFVKNRSQAFTKTTLFTHHQSPHVQIPCTPAHP